LLAQRMQTKSTTLAAKPAPRSALIPGPGDVGPALVSILPSLVLPDTTCATIINSCPNKTFNTNLIFSFITYDLTTYSDLMPVITMLRN
jgi:hypothetical protein